MNDYKDSIVRKIVSFGGNNESIRAILLTSSLCNPNAPVDVLSDFDVELFIEDPIPFTESDEWIKALGPIMALWHWPNEWDFQKGDGSKWMRMVYFQDGTKMDITLAYMAELREMSSSATIPDCYNIGYKVLLDKDGVTKTLKPPTYKAYILSPPTEAQYLSRVEIFWMESTYAAKFLWRDDIVAAKWMLHGLVDRGLREVLEWSIAMEHGWNWKPGHLGRGLTKALDPDTRKELIETYAAGDTDDLWESLFRTTALYRKTAVKVGEKLGYKYPYDSDRRVTIFHQAVRNLDQQTTDRGVLAEVLKKAYEEL